ncbi:hypothetical protein TNIN_40431 [Trichonephila inaurata madagascariensis]|uniref:Uncharacterized protein n=1 Tax=Trichonephila inaurata madagascariensis TaxID=2747483 RepID=A0A8X6Y115_9ARAC|nr:hypothetical protein TNIN_40431 [Trichonephila inaurata madagascariensis]
MLIGHYLRKKEELKVQYSISSLQARVQSELLYSLTALQELLHLQLQFPDFVIAPPPCLNRPANRNVRSSIKASSTNQRP